MNDFEALESFGFRRIDEQTWVFRKEFPYEDGVSRPSSESTSVHAVVVALVNSEGEMTAFVPNIGDEVYAKGVDTIPGKGLFYRTDDVRDVIALAQNEIGSATLETTGIPSEIGFSSDEHGVFVTSAFMTDPWADYGLVDGQDRNADLLQIKAPGDVWGPAYETWRDEFCSAYTAGARPATSAPGMA